MKRIFLLIAAAAFIVPATVSAQETKVTRTEDDNTLTVVEETPAGEGRIVTTTVLEKKSVFTNGFLHNWQLSGGIGTQVYLGENDWKVARKFPEMFTFPTVDLYLTKWASPSFGLGLGANWSKFRGLYQTTPGSGVFKTAYSTANFRSDKVTYYNDADSKYDSQHLAVQDGGSYLNLFALAHADLFNLFCGYQANRLFDIDAYVGGGVIFGFAQSGNIRDASFNAGLLNTLRLTERLRLLLNIRGALIGDAFDGETYLQEHDREGWQANHKFDGIIGATLGLSWNIGKEYSQWRLAERSSVYQYDKETVEKIVREVVEKPAETVVREAPEVWFHINFAVNKWELSKRERVNLHAVADLIKATPETRYLVTGYADKQTATPAHNLTLSQNRAQAVYDTLVNEFGVNPDQLVQDYKGGVDYMFYNEKELSRCVMITPVKEAE